MFKLRSESTKSSCQRPKTFAGACKEAVKQLKTIPSDGEYGFGVLRPASSGLQVPGSVLGNC